MTKIRFFFASILENIKLHTNAVLITYYCGIIVVAATVAATNVQFVLITADCIQMVDEESFKFKLDTCLICVFGC